MKNIEENNLRIIAEFDGKEVKLIQGVLCYVGNNKSPFSLVEYDKDWNQLMPVVEKIENSKSIDIHIYRKFCHIPQKFKQFITVLGKSKLDAPYEAVVKVIKWYNEQK